MIGQTNVWDGFKLKHIFVINQPTNEPWYQVSRDLSACHHSCLRSPNQRASWLRTHRNFRIAYDSVPPLVRLIVAKTWWEKKWHEPCYYQSVILPTIITLPRSNEHVRYLEHPRFVVKSAVSRQLAARESSQQVAGLPGYPAKTVLYGLFCFSLRLSAVVGKQSIRVIVKISMIICCFFLS